MRLLMHLQDRSRLHISAALPVHAIISSPGERREGRGEQLAVSHTVPRTSSGPLRRMRQLKRVHAVSVMQQLQRLTTEQVLLADLHVELRSLLSLLGNQQADQFTCIICTPTLREVITVKILRIIMEFLQYRIMNKSYRFLQDHWRLLRPPTSPIRLTYGERWGGWSGDDSARPLIS